MQRGAVGAGDGQDIAEALGGDEARLDPFAFGQGVDDDGRAVDEESGVGHVEARLVQRVFHADGKVVGRGRSFGQADLPRGLVQIDQVGERPTDVGCYSHRNASFLNSSLSQAEYGTKKRKGGRRLQRVLSGEVSVFPNLQA